MASSGSITSKHLYSGGQIKEKNNINLDHHTGLPFNLASAKNHFIQKIPK
jgi:hypothetical protein